jgi:predicted dehydrogenase
MCEKPLTVYAQDVAELEKASQDSGLMLGVGFQWSFSRRNRALKKDILSGRFGKVLGIKTCISWMRADRYYRSWHGHLFASDGSLLMDSVISNAMAHYLHFGLFLLGPTMDSALMPKSIKASLYRAKTIESFDTCSVQCQFDNGLTHNLYLTHAAISSRYLQIQIQFEHAVASVLSDDSNGCLLVTLEDGTVLNYDEIYEERNVSQEKIDDMIQAVRSPENGVVCHAATTLPFATVCNSLFAEVPIVDFAKEKVIHTDGEEPGEYVTDLFDQLHECFVQNKTPYELGYDWAVPDVEYTLKTPQEYKAILEEKFL